MPLNERIITARKEARMSQDELAKAVGVTRGAVAKWESGEIHPRPATLEKIAGATKKPHTWLVSGVHEGGGGLMAIGKVAAGVWSEGTVEFEAFPAGYSAQVGYPIEYQRVYVVEGSSVNKLVPSGYDIICVDVKGSGETPIDGDFVVVRRMEHGLAEYTVKQLVREGENWILRPASDDPKWQDDIALNGDCSTEIEITDIVIGTHRVVRRKR